MITTLRPFVQPKLQLSSSSPLKKRHFAKPSNLDSGALKGWWSYISVLKTVYKNYPNNLPFHYCLQGRTILVVLSNKRCILGPWWGLSNWWPMGCMQLLPTPFHFLALPQEGVGAWGAHRIEQQGRPWPKSWEWGQGNTQTHAKGACGLHWCSPHSMWPSLAWSTRPAAPSHWNWTSLLEEDLLFPCWHTKWHHVERQQLVQHPAVHTSIMSDAQNFKYKAPPKQRHFINH